MRMAARWAMICYVGLALLAGLGASLCAACIARQRRWVRFCAALIIVLAILFEQRAAPLDLIRGEVEPDPLSIYLAQTSMSGGIVDLPAGRGTAGNQRYMLRAADHKRPIVVATNSFVPPLDAEIQDLTHSQPLPERFLDLLESIPASYLVVHQVFLSPKSRANMEAFLGRGVGTGRLKFIHRFDYQQGDGLIGYNDLYAVTKTEPAAISEVSLPPAVSYQEYAPLWQYLPPGFQESSFFVYRLHLASTGRLPRLAEFAPAARAALAQMGDRQTEDGKQALVEAWTQTAEFKTEYAGKTNEQYVDELLTNARVLSRTIDRNALVKDLEAGTATRATVLRKICDDEAFLLSEFDSAFVLLNYFAYFQRDPDEGGLAYWVEWLNGNGRI